MQYPLYKGNVAEYGTLKPFRMTRVPWLQLNCALVHTSGACLNRFIAKIQQDSYASTNL